VPADGGARLPATAATGSAGHCVLAPDVGALSDGLSRAVQIVSDIGTDHAVCVALEASPYRLLPTSNKRDDIAELREAGRSLTARAAAAERALPYAIEKPLGMRNGRVVDRDGGNPPVYNYSPAAASDDVNTDDDIADSCDLPDSTTTWAETLAGVQSRTVRPPNPLPELPAWTTPRFRTFLQTARFTPEQIRKITRSPDLAARRICEHAESLASSWTLDDERKEREPQTDRAHVVLRNMLALADEIRGLQRTEESRLLARFESVRQLPKSKRRTEMMGLYRELLERQARPTRDERRQQDIADIYAEECRGRVSHHTHNSVRNGWYLWDPPTDAERFATKNKAVSSTYNETPIPLCAYMDMRAPDSTEHQR
jgi:hypothetical protein